MAEDGNTGTNVPLAAPALVDVKTDTVRALNPRTWPTDYRVYAICGVVVASVLYLAGEQRWGAIKFDSKASVPSVLGSMLAVALFVERVIEVFVSVWVDRASAIHEQNLDYWQSRQAQLGRDVQALITERNGQPAPDTTRIAAIDTLLVSKRADIDGAVKCADDEAKALLPFRARTLKVSTWVGLTIGVAVSAAGFRFLAQLVSVPTDAAFLNSGQYQCFLGVDMLLTGAVLAGGSKLIHNIFSVYSSFMNTTSKNLSDASKSS